MHWIALHPEHMHMMLDAHSMWHPAPAMRRTRCQDALAFPCAACSMLRRAWAGSGAASDGSVPRSLSGGPSGAAAQSCASLRILWDADTCPYRQAVLREILEELWPAQKLSVHVFASGSQARKLVERSVRADRPSGAPLTRLLRPLQIHVCTGVFPLPSCAFGLPCLRMPCVLSRSCVGC